MDDFFSFSKKWIFGYSWSTLLWYRCYYPHRLRDALSPVCGIFFTSVHMRWELDEIITAPTSLREPCRQVHFPSSETLFLGSETQPNRPKRLEPNQRFSGIRLIYLYDTLIKGRNCLPTFSIQIYFAMCLTATTVSKFFSYYRHCNL